MSAQNIPPGIDLVGYFTLRVKEQILSSSTGGKIGFIFKIILLCNWDKIVQYMQFYSRKYWDIYFSGRFNKSIKRITKCQTKMILNKNDELYSTVQSFMMYYEPTRDHPYYSENGITFYAYRQVNDKNSQSSNSSIYTDCEIEVKSNFTREETIYKIMDIVRAHPAPTLQVKSIIDSDTQSLPNVTFQNAFMDVSVEDLVTNFVRTYEQRDTIYKRLGCVHKTNFLLYGPPGTGKTTMIKLIACSLRRSLFRIDLRATNDVSKLRKAIVQNAKSSVIVMEEFDCLLDRIKERNNLSNNDPRFDMNLELKRQLANNNQTETEKATEVDLGFLLELLDGTGSIAGSVIIFTTNHVDKIDNAFKRPGRMDYIIEMKLCSKYQFQRMFTFYLKTEPSQEIMEKFPDHTYSTATISTALIRNYLITSRVIDDVNYERALEFIDAIHQETLKYIDHTLQASNALEITEKTEDDIETIEV
jgi:AAA+ superfamily predicted ATPase